MTLAVTTRRARFLPYRFATHALELAIEQCVIDGRRELVPPYDRDRRLVDVAGGRFDSLRLGLVVDLAADVLRDVFPAHERADAEGRVIVTVTCVATRLRTAVVLADGVLTAGAVRGQLELSMCDLRGVVELVPMLVRRSARPEAEDGFATLAGSRLADGPAIEVRIDVPRAPHGEYLDIRYDSFRGKGPPQFPRPDALYQLDCDGDQPVLWLNLDHAHVCAVLDGAGNVGRVARVRNVIFAQIGQAVWTRLFWHAARSLHRAGEVVHPWQDAVLAHLLPGVYPDVCDHESRVAALRADLDQGADDGVMARLDGALQALLEVAAAADKVAEELA